MARLIALDLPGTPQFVTALRRAWDAGAAVFPVDQRLPAPFRRQLLDRIRPHAVVGGDGEEVRRSRGFAVQEGDALVVATSGTTGEHRGVVLTHAAVAAHAWAVHRRLGVDPGQDRWLACLPLAHMGGLGVLVRAIVTGTPVEIHPGFEPEVLRAAARDGANLVSLVPTALDRVDADWFRWVVLGGSADSASERPPNVVRTYGLTESGGGVVYAGRPLDGTQVRLAGGEIQLRGPTLARAYREAGAERPVTGEDGWLATGDIGELGADGRLTVRGRAGDLIVTGGENVWPEPVEAVLASQPGVAEVAVAGRPDLEWGQRVVAWVVPAQGGPAPDLEQLRAAVRDQLPAFMAPKELVLVEALARTNLGKVRRSQLP